MTTDEQSRRTIVTRLTEIPRSELDLKALGGRMIEHVASPNGDYYTAFGGDPGLIGNDVVAYYVREDGTPIMLQRCHRPSSRAELEKMRVQRDERKAAQRPRRRSGANS